MGALFGDKSPLGELELGKYGIKNGILINEYHMKGGHFYRTADANTKIGGLSMHNITQNSQLNTFIGHQ